MEYQKALTSIIERTYKTFTPPPDMTLAEWADEHARLSPESAAEPGRWNSIPYQVGIMEAMSDPNIERVTMLKSARVGYTKMLNNLIGYHVHLDPCNILIVQPTIEDAQGYSKDEIATMIRDTPVLDGLISNPKTRDGSNTILKKAYPGGTLYLVGANSPRGFRRISARVVLFDEVDGYPASAGTEGDQIKLGIMRSNFFWNRKIVMGSTPTIKGESKIENHFENSDKRYYFVPCPHCHEYQTLKWSGIQWPDNDPQRAYYVCEHCASIIDHSLKQWMVERGEWRATQEFNGHAGFHIWAAYSYSPNAAWSTLAEEFLECRRDSEALQTFTNTVLGETWEDEAEQPDWNPLLERQERYESPAAGAYVLTAGVDIQKDRIEMAVEGWAPGEENWQIEYLWFYGDTTEPQVWEMLSEALDRTYHNDDGALLGITATMIDSGYNTDMVYSFCKRHAHRNVYATKGLAGSGLPIVDRAVKKKTGRDPTSVRRFNIGVDGAKAVIYNRLQINEPGPGYRHFNHELQPEYFEQLVAEKIVTKKRRGFEYREWVKTRPRNEALDIAVLNYAALKVINPQWDTFKVKSAPPTTKSAPSRQFSSRSGRGFERR